MHASRGCATRWPPSCGCIVASSSTPPDGLPVDLLFFLFVPEAANQRHLDILAEIAEMLSDRAMRETLLKAADAAELHAMVSAWRRLGEA